MDEGQNPEKVEEFSPRENEVNDLGTAESCLKRLTRRSWGERRGKGPESL